NARKDDGPGIAARSQNAIELTSRNNIESRSFARQQRKNREIRIRFDGETDAMRHPLQSIFIRVESLPNRRCRVDVRRSSEFVRYCFEARTFAPQGFVLVAKFTQAHHSQSRT